MDFVSKQELIKINQYAVNQTGENHFVRDDGLLESALNRPIHYQRYEDCDDVLMLAIILAEAILQNHVFEQGNKRTAFAAMLRMINVNGWKINRKDDGSLAQMFLDLTTHKITIDSFYSQLSGMLVPYDKQS